MEQTMKGLILVMGLALTAPALADQWKPLPTEDGSSWEMDPESLQLGTRPDSTGSPQAIHSLSSMWVRTVGTTNKEAAKQVWIDCRTRESQTFDHIWLAWRPIAPETMEWALWKYLCKS